MTAPVPNAIAKAAKHALWKLGDLSWKLDDTQLAIYDQIKATEGRQFVFEGARKLGKSYMHGCIALETAIQNAGKQINWVAGSAVACKRFLVPILEEISLDAPPECKGEYHSQSGQWRMPNGSFIQVFGVETKRDCERGRGPSAILSILDESGFMDLLEYLMDSILAPQQRRIKRLVGTFVGMTLLCSTTPYTPSHYFCRVADGASVDGSYAKRTIYDSGFESKDAIDRYIIGEAAKKGLSVEAFKQTSTFRREYLSERVVDETVVAFPEFARTRELVVKDWPRPKGFETFIYRRVSIDLGLTDKTAILFGYVDFTNAKIVIEDELLLTSPTTAQVAEAVIKKEAELWPEAQPGRVYRVVDDPAHGRAALDFWDLKKLRAENAQNKDPLGAIGLIRTYLNMGTLVIHPRCVNLQKQLLETEYAKVGHHDFKRNEDGHADLAASCMYFVRSSSELLKVNPYPPDWDIITGRKRPAHHPIEYRKAIRGETQQHGLAAQLLGKSKWVQGQLGKKK